MKNESSEENYQHRATMFETQKVKLFVVTVGKISQYTAVSQVLSPP